MTDTCYYWCPCCAEKVPTDDVAHTMPLTHARCGNNVEAFDPAWERGAIGPEELMAGGCLVVVFGGIVLAWALGY